MSSGELFVIALVSLAVFGPKKLPMLATHLGILIKKFHSMKNKASLLWQQQLNELKLYENKLKAEEVDKKYK